MNAVRDCKRADLVWSYLHLKHWKAQLSVPERVIQRFFEPVSLGLNAVKDNRLDDLPVQPPILVRIGAALVRWRRDPSAGSIRRLKPGDCPDGRNAATC